LPLGREFYSLVDCCVLSCLEKKKLIQAKSQNVAKIGIDPRRAEATEPKIEQS
jgi:hypothetical protein